MAKGTREDPITTDEDRQYKFCRCEVCDVVEECTPNSDFFKTPGSELLKCKECFADLVKSEHKENNFYTWTPKPLATNETSNN